MFNEHTQPFVCLEDISGLYEPMNHVLYPLGTDKEFNKRNMKKIIKGRFGYELSDDDLNKLVSYTKENLTSFIKDLKHILGLR